MWLAVVAGGGGGGKGSASSVANCFDAWALMLEASRDRLPFLLNDRGMTEAAPLPTLVLDVLPEEGPAAGGRSEKRFRLSFRTIPKRRGWVCAALSRSGTLRLRECTALLPLRIKGFREGGTGRLSGNLTPREDGSPAGEDSDSA